MSATPDTLANPERRIADLERQLAECKAERDEALQRETATAEVLQVINSSPSDPAPVFDTILQKASRLCDASFGIFWIYDGGLFHAAIVNGAPEFADYLRKNPQKAPPESDLGRLLRGENVIHREDYAVGLFPNSDLNRAFRELGGGRSGILVALRRDDELLGAIRIFRQEVLPFTDKQVALLQNFAAQAVIAMENARLLTETREALEQQTATAEVLQVINSSPGDLAPVFDAMLAKATRLCEGQAGHVLRYENGAFSRAASFGVPDEFDEILPLNVPVPHIITRDSVPYRMLASRAVVHLPSVREDESYRRGAPAEVTAVEKGGIQTALFVPLLKEGEVVGCFVLCRMAVRPFTDKQIALVQNFAAQAVIAIENARLLGELRERTADLQESLEYQTAISDVLKVISQSGSELGAVLDTLVGTAARICQAESGFIFRLQDGFQKMIASFGIPPEYKEFQLRTPIAPGRGTLAGRITLERRAVHIDDAATDPDYTRAEAVQLGRQRTMLGAPLVREDVLIGAITLARTRVEPFTAKQIELVTTFADQAAIAIENARLLTETREALEQQTATAEVLQVINASPGDLAPVFDAMLDKALRLCEAAFGLMASVDGNSVHAIAQRNVPLQFLEFLRRLPPGRGPDTFIGRAILERTPIHVVDILTEEPFQRANPLAVAAVERAGMRTLLLVPLVRDDVVLGVFSIYRREVRPFSEKQIALLQNFAAQAVIAMENARLLTETREALEQQTATAEVLQVINSSPGDLAPVFDAMLEKAMRLCQATGGALRSYDGDAFHAVAMRGMPTEFLEATRKVRTDPDSGLGRIERGEHVVQIADFTDTSHPRAGTESWRWMTELGGIATSLWVALRKEASLLGTFVLYRKEVRPFTDKEISLVENFAAQAVIAMENARLIDEIRQRQAELRVTFDNMVDGVAMFDEALDLAAWNRNFQELLQLPDELLAKRHDFNTFIRYLAERGEFGEADPEREIARLRARIGDHYSFERTRPDGTVIEVRHNPMPGGGIVLIYSDITERKRSEAEIKAARDAAEAAYRDLKAAQASLIQAEKMASLGQLTAGIAHEIKNPLNFVNNFAGLSVELLDELKETAAPAISALDNEKRAEIDETITMLSGNLDKIAEHGRRADNIVTSMLEHSRGSSGERRSIDLNALVEEALNLAYHGGRARDQSFNITLERDYADALVPIELVPQDITRVCLNLFGNGFYAATKRQKEGGDTGFTPTLKVSTRDLGKAVEIRVRDNGIGIAPEIKDKLFQPFFTTKPSGEGTGLGLSISYDIVTQQHGGTITVDSRVGEFTEFTVQLPRSSTVALN